MECHEKYECAKSGQRALKQRLVFGSSPLPQCSLPSLNFVGCHKTCGSRLACDGITAVLQANLTACIASKPAPTG